jgi:hypothetical protein
LPCSRVPRRLQDIIDNARAIFGYTDGMDLTAFEENRRVYDAAERIRSFGNALRHEYDTIREDRLFEIVRIDLRAPVRLRRRGAATLELFKQQ